MSRSRERGEIVRQQLGELRGLRDYMVRTGHAPEEYAVLDDTIADLEARLEGLRPPSVWERLVGEE